MQTSQIARFWLAGFSVILFSQKMSAWVNWKIRGLLIFFYGSLVVSEGYDWHKGMGLKWHFLAIRQLCGGFLCRRNNSLGECGDQRATFFSVGLLGALEARNCEKDPPRKERGLEICGRTCSELWLGKQRVVVVLNQTNWAILVVGTYKFSSG